MSKYLSEKYKDFDPYTPGEQPQNREYVKLNTNESPFPPSPFAQRLSREAAGDLMLYSDPDVRKLLGIASEKLEVKENELIFSNGSDEILSFIFLAFCDENTTVYFPDITYGFYKVLSNLYGIKYKEIPVKSDFSVEPNDYKNLNGPVFIANPNAQTGLYLSKGQIEEIVCSNNDIVVIDEAYIDFGNESALPLINKYDNLIVVRTFSKSRSLAGARLGFAMANNGLIRDLNTIKYSVNPYNVNIMTMYAGIGALSDENYFQKNCSIIVENREYLKAELKKLDFYVTDSKSNFVLAKNSKISGQRLYESLKQKGVLVRHFDDEKIKNYVRITVGTKEQLDILINRIKEIL